MRTIIPVVLIILMSFSSYKIGYLRSEIKFIEMVKSMIDMIDPQSLMAEYNLEFIRILQEAFEIERED